MVVQSVPIDTLVVMGLVKNTKIGNKKWTNQNKREEIGKKDTLTISITTNFQEILYGKTNY